PPPRARLFPYTTLFRSVAAKAMDRLGRPRGDIHAFTMPGFATTSQTKERATRLSRSLGVTFEELDIRPAAERMLQDLGHPYSSGDRKSTRLNSSHVKIS